MPKPIRQRLSNHVTGIASSEPAVPLVSMDQHATIEQRGRHLGVAEDGVEAVAGVTSLFRSDSAARSTCGGPIIMAAHETGSTIQPGIETTMPDGPSTLKN